MPVHMLTQSVLKWPDPAEVLTDVHHWVVEQANRQPALGQVAIYGRYGRGDAGVGSDLDLLLIDVTAQGPKHGSLRHCPLK